MPSIELKSLEYLRDSDRVLVDIGGFIKAGRPLEEKGVKLLARHKVLSVPIIELTYEEKRKLPPEEQEAFLQKAAEKYSEPFAAIRYRLWDKLKNIYQTYSEEDKAFQAPGKKKQIIKDTLLQRKPEVLYRRDIEAGSLALIPAQDLRFLKEMLQGIYKALTEKKLRDEESYRRKDVIPRIRLHSARLMSFYEQDRLSAQGDALAWHAADCAVYFLTAAVNINKLRITQGKPFSESRFNPDNSSEMDQEFQYHDEMLIDAALGVLLQKIGLAHSTIQQMISSRPILDAFDPAMEKKLHLIRRFYYAGKNLLADRHDISAVTRMMVSQAFDYPDLTGYPPPYEHKFLNELVRLFHVIDHYDGMTNPLIGSSLFSRMEVIRKLSALAGNYSFSTSYSEPQQRLDSGMVQAFLTILAPYDQGEKVYLAPAGETKQTYFVGRVFSYGYSPIPLISILKDRRRDKAYGFGQVIFDLENSRALFIKKGKVVKQERHDWIEKLIIQDSKIATGSLQGYEEPLFGRKRSLSKRVK